MGAPVQAWVAAHQVKIVAILGVAPFLLGHNGCRILTGRRMSLFRRFTILVVQGCQLYSTVTSNRLVPRMLVSIFLHHGRAAQV